jgi:hypothetical protein
MGQVFFLAELNWLAILVAAIAAFVLGGAWYSPRLFGNAWMQDVGLTEESAAESNMAFIFGGAFALILIAAIFLGATIGDSTWQGGLHTGLVVGVAWVATAYGVTYLFERRPLRLFLVNAGYNIVLFALMGTIIGAWH